jgi:acetyltransferase-like isoleucine patch superfamily enzyme
MMRVAGSRTVPGDWHPGTIPDNAEIDPAAVMETSYSFELYRSTLPVGLSVGRGSSVYLGTMLDIGKTGRVSIGEFCLLNGARIICDSSITIGDYALISWNVVLMDSYRLPRDMSTRRELLRGTTGESRRDIDGYREPRPIAIGRNVWIGFDSCVLPGVAIGDGAVVGARSVVVTDVEAYTVVAGNPARVVRKLDPSAHPERDSHAG